MGKSHAGKGDTPRPVNRTKYEEGYKRAFGLCINSTCPKRYTCYRWLKTPAFRQERCNFPGGLDCPYYVKCTTKNEYEKLENK